MKTIRIGLLGLGNIGTGTYKTLEMNKNQIQSSTGVSIEITKILERDVDRKRDIKVSPEQFTQNPDDIFLDPSIDIVIELLGGIEPASSFMLKALQNKKHVVTANKAAVAANYDAFMEAAKENQVMFRYEASVGGGIPILNALTTALLANEYEEILGIVNGTTNYILTQMTENGLDYADVLKTAQEKGFAEADPTADVEGIDVANKLSILISLVFGVRVTPDEIPTEGITKISMNDINLAAQFGYKIKLLATAKKVNNLLECHVQPAFVPLNHPLASVSNEFNAIFVKGNAVDDLMFYGKGAGPLPTGSAVMGDVIEISRAIAKGAAFDHYPESKAVKTLKFVGEGQNKYYVNLTVKDVPGVLGSISTTFGAYGIGIDSVLQLSKDINSKREVPLVFILHEVTRSRLDEALAKISSCGYASEVKSIIRVM
ncbi:homoserine dehydrogenase [Sinanaerobacter chloroacetimidivorans]|jgi:homoserine dehydrogenase|uniref:Homoserine dehydrogenase n=1 Tax=Sinanaerobacter chloroacetimidivorans TaxID=2818044 RepID=A0A8J8B2W4_9FIRM|nr:homoserine dehydrogenase [Sinanaerobacter chloroacetimidivorans]MBR0600263.1 homoserine dehydrogenase [Sinanaerobacter chloroacetimidivorans]